MTPQPKLVADRTEHGKRAACRRLLNGCRPRSRLAAKAVPVPAGVVLAPAAEMADGPHDDGLRRRVARRRSATIVNHRVFLITRMHPAPSRDYEIVPARSLLRPRLLHP